MPIPRTTLVDILRALAKAPNPRLALPNTAHHHHVTVGELHELVDQHGYPYPEAMRAAADKLELDVSQARVQVAAGQTLVEVPLGQLRPDPNNPRTDLEGIDELADSIATAGLIQPIVARRVGNDLVIVAGHRRKAALINLRHKTTAVIIREDDTTPEQNLAAMLIENCQRSDLHPLDRAAAYGALREQRKSLVEIAALTGVTAATVSRYLALLDLPDDERAELRAGRFSTEEALAMVRAGRADLRRRHKPTAGAVGRPKGRKTTPHFSKAHPLAQRVRAVCDHTGTPKLDGVGCGRCWEAVIRADATSKGGTR